VKKAEKRQGNLPLHLAAIHGCSDGVWLSCLLLFTEYAGVANTAGMTPLDLALDVGHHCSDDFLHLLEIYGVLD
jgi:ankyrin repeat protein